MNRLYLEGNILSMKDDAPYVLAMEYTLSWIIHNERVPFDKIKQTLLPDGPIDKESHCAMNKMLHHQMNHLLRQRLFPTRPLQNYRKRHRTYTKAKQTFFLKTLIPVHMSHIRKTPVPGNRVSLEHSPVYPCRNGVIKTKTGAISSLGVLKHV